MYQRCEVCESFRPEGTASERKLVEVPFDVRSVVLCQGHARIAEKSGVQSFAELRELFGSGRRSFVPRRAPRVSAQVLDNRQGPGRRATDRWA